MCASRVLLPALACHMQSEEGRSGGGCGAQGRGEHVFSHEPVTSTLREPRVTHKTAQAA